MADKKKAPKPQPKAPAPKTGGNKMPKMPGSGKNC